MPQSLLLDLVIRTSIRKAEAKSPQQQRDMAQAVLDLNGHRLGMVHDSGADESGKTMDRPTIHAVMERVRTHQTDGVIVALVDRMGRAPIEEAMRTVRDLDAIGGVFVPADLGGQPVDLSDPMAETNLVIQFQIARQFWAMTAKRFRRSQTDAVKAGKHVGPTPLGYVRRKGRLYPHPTLGPIVREAFRRAARDGLAAAVTYLQSEVPERTYMRKGQPVTVASTWNTDSVRKLLATRTYLGESRVRAKAGKLERLDAHEPLTTLEDFNAAQTTARHRHANGDYPLSTIARCACGAGLHGQRQTFAKYPDRVYRRYRCSDSKCRGGSSCDADALEAIMLDALERGLADEAWVARFVPGDLTAARGELERAESELDAFAVQTPATSRAYAPGLAAREAALDEAQARFQVLAGQAARSQFLPSADELADPEQFARALRATVDRIDVRRGRGALIDRIDVVWADALDTVDNGVGQLAA